MRYYIGVDWADAEHMIWVENEQGARVLSRSVPHAPEGLAEWDWWLDEQRASGAGCGPPSSGRMGGCWTASWTTGEAGPK